MPAHLLPLPRCSNSGCNKAAEFVLRNTANAPINLFCRSHGSDALRDWKLKYEGGEIELDEDFPRRRGIS